MFVEVADRVYVARYRQWDVNVGLVVGSDAALVVDTRAAARQGREIVRDSARVLGRIPVRHVVNTHVHFDHTFGNVAFDSATIHAQDNAARALSAHREWVVAQLQADPGDCAEYGYTAVDVADLLATPVRAPDRSFAQSTSIDLGGRVVTARHAGRGHTDGDAAVLVPDCGVAFLGDLVEESGPPSFGPDCWPLEWPATLSAILAEVTEGAVVIPGHGAPVDRAYALAQCADIATVASVIGERLAEGLTLADAQREPDSRLSYPLEMLADAFARGWQQSGSA